MKPGTLVRSLHDIKITAPEKPDILKGDVGIMQGLFSTTTEVMCVLILRTGTEYRLATSRFVEVVDAEEG